MPSGLPSQVSPLAHPVLTIITVALSYRISTCPPVPGWLKTAMWSLRRELRICLTPGLSYPRGLRVL